MLALSGGSLHVQSTAAGSAHVQMLGAKPNRQGSDSEGKEHGQAEEVAGGSAAGTAQQENSSPKVGAVAMDISLHDAEISSCKHAKLRGALLALQSLCWAIAGLLVSSNGGATVLLRYLAFYKMYDDAQGSPRDSETDGKGLLPKMQSINWNQDLSGTPISLHETFDSSGSTDGAGRGEPLCQAMLSTSAAFSICVLLPNMLGPIRVTSCARASQPEEAPLLGAPQCSASKTDAACVLAGLDSA